MMQAEEGASRGVRCCGSGRSAMVVVVGGVVGRGCGCVLCAQW